MTYRDELEALALEAVCACWVYELRDNMESTTNDELLEFIRNPGCCPRCNEDSDNFAARFDAIISRVLAGVVLLVACLSIGCDRPSMESQRVIESINCEYDDLGPVTEYHLTDGRVLMITADHSEVIIRN